MIRKSLGMAATLLASQIVAASAQAQNSPAQQWQGPARGELKAFAQRQKAMLDIPMQLAFYGDFNSDGQEDAVVFIYTNIEGAAGNFNLKVALFKGEKGRYRFMRYVPDIFGQEPRDAMFSNGKVQITTVVPKPGDPRCCPTGSRRFTIRTI